MRSSLRLKLLIVLVIVLFLYLFFLYFPKPTKSLAASEFVDKPFDHSNCQYPDRSTNPPNACDNSDPCDGANLKGTGSGACTNNTQTQTEQDIPMSHNISPVDKPVEVVHKCE